MNMPKLISEIYEGKEKIYTNKDADEIGSWYRLLLVGHNASGFLGRVVLYSLFRKITDLKIIKTARLLISLFFSVWS